MCVYIIYPGTTTALSSIALERDGHCVAKMWSYEVTWTRQDFLFGSGYDQSELEELGFRFRASQ